MPNRISIATGRRWQAVIALKAIVRTAETVADAAAVPAEVAEIADAAGAVAVPVAVAEIADAVVRAGEGTRSFDTDLHG
jgi:hypothetical protein